MIDKLRKKIFWIIQISLTVIILGIIILYAGVSYRNTIRSAAVFINRIDGMFPFAEDFEGIYRFEIADDIILNESDNTTDEVREYAMKIINKRSEEGHIGNYIYKARKFGDSIREITLMENEEAITRLKTTVVLAVAVGFAGICLIYVFAKKISQIIVEPVEESFEKQKQFVSDASHELKTPLAVIEANADVLQTKVGDSKWITYIQNEVQSMNKLVNDLLLLAKTENRSDISIQKFNLAKEVQMSVAVFESMIYEKEIKLETNIDEEIDFSGEKEDIKHIVSIILDNAIKHTEKGNSIIVNAQNEKNDVKIEIKNQGEPIPEEEQEKIFERFYRVDKARNRNEKRYGLGLSIAKGIVDKYDGTIKASSKDGFTSFAVKLKNRTDN